MKKIKKVFISVFNNRKQIVCLGAIVILILTGSYQAQDFQVNESFFMKDISNHWAEDSIKALAFMGILKGDNEGNANPDDNITRAEFLALLLRTEEKEEEKAESISELKDVKPNDWYYDLVNIAVEEGLLKGNRSGLIMPEKEITREEMIILIARTLSLRKTDLSSKHFKDISDKYLYLEELSMAINDGIISGYPDNTFRPQRLVSRAEAATIMNRLLKRENTNKDISYEKKEIESFISRYITEYLAFKNEESNSLEYNYLYSTGKEYEDNTAKEKIVKLYFEKGIQVKESIQEVNMSVYELSGRLANVKVSNVSTFERSFKDGTNRVKEYKSEKDISLIKRDGKWKIYNTKHSILKNEKVNMTWEYVAINTPDMKEIGAIPGLNVVSPTWFEIGNEKNLEWLSKPKSFIYEDNDMSIQMVDLGEKEYIDWAHENGYDVWALLRNEFDIDVASKILNNKETRQNTIEQLVEYTEKYKLDGINIDFEYLYYEDRDVLSQFIRELALVLREMGAVTSIDVTKIEPTSIRWSMCYDRKALGEAADYMALMAYDQNGEWSTKSGSVAQLKWVEKAVTDMLKQVPAKKVILGLPFYTRLWEEQEGKVISAKAISMGHAQRLINENNATLTWDDESGQYIAGYSKDGRTYSIWVEDAKSISLKASLIDKYNLAGTAGWRRGLETPDIWEVLVR
jgi:hypothetical protein